MTQYAQPISDQSTGNWQTSPIWSKIDGLTPDSSAVISPDNPTGGPNDTFKCKLGSILKPDSGSQTLTVRLKRTGSDEIPVSIALMEGGTTIAFTNVTPTTSYKNYSLTLTQEEIDSITDYADLSVLVAAGGPFCGCLSPIPQFLTATFFPGSDDNCACVSGDIIIRWNADDQLWRGTGPFGTCGRSVALELTCESVSPIIFHLLFTFSGCPYSANISHGVVCSPLYLDFGGTPIDEECCNDVPPPTGAFSAIVTE